MASLTHTHTHTKALGYNFAETKNTTHVRHHLDWFPAGVGVGVGAGMGARGCSQRNIMLLTILAFSPFTYILIISQDGFCVDYKNTHTHTYAYKGGMTCVAEGCKI